MIEARDCDFHAVPPEHRETFAESNYFPFHIPAAGLSGCVYTIFRPGLGVCMSDVTIFDRRADHWEGLAYTDNQQHIPCPSSLTDYSLRNGLHVRAVAPPREYRIDYVGIDDTELHFDFRGAMRPQDFNDPEQDPLTRAKGSGTGSWDEAFNGHFDMTGRVTGKLRLRGVDHPIDCLATMDHSWGPRVERDNGSAVVVQADFGDGLAIHAMAAFDPRRSDAIGPVLHGYVLRDGVVRGLVAGSGSVQRTGLRADAITVTLEDEDGRAYALAGRMRNWAPWAPYSSVIYYSGLAEWQMGAQTGHGPYQEILSRAFVARHRLSS
jgi:hypothetical protein